MSEGLESFQTNSVLRILILGPIYPSSTVGGLQLALGSLSDQLGKRGWDVDISIYPKAEKKSTSIDPENSNLRQTMIISCLTKFQRWNLGVRLWGMCPVRFRQIAAIFFKPAVFFENNSNNLRVIQSMLTASRKYDLVLVCVEGSSPGLEALVNALHPHVALIGLGTLANHIRAEGWSLMRFVARLHLGRRMHPYLYRSLLPEEVKLAIFASRRWRDEALGAGLPAKAAHTIYFGIPLPDPMPRPVSITGRLLWVGRLSPEKGLHLLLRALPIIKDRVKEVQLTAVAAQGSEDYERLIQKLINRMNLQQIVTLRPSVGRDALQEFYAGHDLLFFHSMYAEPVAFVLMEAFAAGLPVVASRPKDGYNTFVQDGLTCLCYQPASKESVASAVVRMLTDAPLRTRLALSAQKLVRQNFSLDKMGKQFDSLLRQFVARDANDG
jgi:glycosyltransferase involved in cell wall biosynthesis